VIYKKRYIVIMGWIFSFILKSIHLESLILENRDRIINLRFS